MLLTIKTLPNEFPEIFVNRIIISLIILSFLCAISVIRYRKRKIDKTQMIVSVILSVYIVALFYLTVFGRYSHKEYEYKIYFYNSYRSLFEHFSQESIKQIFINIAMMVPVGFMLPIVIKCKRKYVITIITALVIILLIESLQLVTKCGTFEVDDIINNLIGTAAGIVLYKIFGVLKKYNSDDIT